MAEGITLDELLAACKEAGCAGASETRGLTRAELCKAWSCGDRLMTRRMQQANEAGILRTGRRLTTNLAGVPSSVPVYWFELPKKVKGRK